MNRSCTCNMNTHLIFFAIIINFYLGNSSHQSLVHLYVHGEAIHPEKKQNLNQCWSMTGQEPGGGQLDMVGGEGGGMQKEEATEGKEGDSTDNYRVNIVG